MAIDTARKRRAAAIAAGARVAPLPDSDIDAGDRAIVAGVYTSSGQTSSGQAEGGDRRQTRLRSRYNHTRGYCA